MSEPHPSIPALNSVAWALSQLNLDQKPKPERIVCACGSRYFWKTMSASGDVNALMYGSSKGGVVEDHPNDRDETELALTEPEFITCANRFCAKSMRNPDYIPPVQQADL